MGYRSSYARSSYGDPWAPLVTLAVLLAALVIWLTFRMLVQIAKHMTRAFAREPTHPVLWVLVAATGGLGGLALLVSATPAWTGVALALGILAALALLLLILVSTTISLTSEQVLPTEPESLVTTTFKRSWW